MLSCLLLLLNLALFGGTVRYIKDYITMMSEVLNRRVSEFFHYGCQCGFVTGHQILDGIDRCCYELRCCRTPLRTDKCNPNLVSFYYTYRNGTITCDNEDESGCARKSCECAREAVLCFRGQNFSKRNAKYHIVGKCEGGLLPC
ncbi:hypothetical protein GDO81_021687 [Engystomops pustulosus]|uniref:Phospholipase A2 n=1 Tax=Engystomops pustulosus TaxID=76066 RepID=A0AAV6ZPD0_ENGPU|nr:hypothetical protein GDO81_021687 [Engystomops pustulosus]KAG8549302.1 hypothetical protein GDO81_021687 [Engystomops pustulosus]